MPDDESYREVRYELERGEYLLSIFNEHRVQRVIIDATWTITLTIKLQPNETCDIEEVTT